MKKIIQNWINGCKVFLRFILFYIVLHIFASIVSSIVLLFIPLILMIPKDQLKDYNDLILGSGLILCLTIFLPLIFHFVSETTGLLQGKPKTIPVTVSPENKKKGKQLMKKLKERKKTKFKQIASPNSDFADAKFLHG